MLSSRTSQVVVALLCVVLLVSVGLNSFNDIGRGLAWKRQVAEGLFDSAIALLLLVMYREYRLALRRTSDAIRSRERSKNLFVIYGTLLVVLSFVWLFGIYYFNRFASFAGFLVAICGFAAFIVCGVTLIVYRVLSGWFAAQKI